VIATGFDGNAAGGRPIAATHSYAQPRQDYDRSRLYHVGSGGTQNNANNGASPYTPAPPSYAQPQSYSMQSVQPANVAHQPTGPVQPARPLAQPMQQSSTDTSKQRAVTPPPLPARGQLPIANDVEDEYEYEDDGLDLDNGEIPMPEPEVQPLQRQGQDTGRQRPIRRLDRSAIEMSRGNRNVPSGDAIDIPAFLRKR